MMELCIIVCCIIMFVVSLLIVVFKPLIVRWYRIRRYYDAVVEEADRQYFSGELRAFDQSQCGDSNFESNVKSTVKSNVKENTEANVESDINSNASHEGDSGTLVSKSQAPEELNIGSVQFSGICRGSKNEFVEDIELTDLNMSTVKSKCSTASKTTGLELPKNSGNGYISCESAINGTSAMNFAGLP